MYLCALARADCREQELCKVMRRAVPCGLMIDIHITVIVRTVILRRGFYLIPLTCDEPCPSVVAGDDNAVVR